MKKSLFAIAIIYLSTVCALAAGTNVYVAHIGNVDGWSTQIKLYSDVAVGVYLTRYDDAGVITGTVNYDLPPREWFTIPTAAILYNGAARVRSDGNVIVKAEYQYEQNPLKCIFMYKGTMSQYWTANNENRPDLSWSGIGFGNPSLTATANITIIALQNGAEVGRKTVALLPLGRYAQMSYNIWEGVGYHDFDTMLVESDQPIQAPIVICGSDDMSNYNFFHGQVTPLSATAQWTPLVAGGGQGQFNVLPKGGSGTYTYRWDIGETLPVISTEQSPTARYCTTTPKEIRVTTTSSDGQSVYAYVAVYTDIPVPVGGWEYPADGTIVSSDIPVRASFTSTRSIVRIDLYSNGVLGASVEHSPWIAATFTGSAQPAGKYEFKAVATDDLGQTQEAVVNLTVYHP